MVREMVTGYNEYSLPEEDAACLWGSALYVRKETTETMSASCAAIRTST